MSYRMPRLPIDYSRTIIYKIVCNDLKIKECYVGATTQFTKRKNGHKLNCINEKSRDYNCEVYKFIRTNGGWNNWTMVMVEQYPCKTKLESGQRERHWIETLKAELNINVPSRNEKERRKQSGYDKMYYEKNKEQILKKQTQHKEEKKQYDLEFRNKNKEQLSEKHKEKITCECGLICNKCHLLRHQKTKKHIELMKINY